MKDMYIDVRQDSNRSIFTIKCDPKSSIRNLKERIKKDYGIPLYCQKLYFDGNELSDNKIFSDYKIKSTVIDKYYEGRSCLYLYILNDLKVKTTIRDRIFDYSLEACDSIFNLKEAISKNLNIPVDKIIIMHSNKIIDDKQLVENFIPNLSFKIQFLGTDKIKINVINESHNEIICVDKFSFTDDIFNILNKDYDFRLKYNDKYIYAGKFIFEYNLKNGDTIEIIKFKPNKIKLIVKMGTNNIKNVIVYPEEPLCILLDMLNIDKFLKLFFNGIAYSVASILTFEEIGITKDTKIYLNNQAISGCNKIILN